MSPTLLPNLFLIVSFLAIFYFLFLLPAKRRQQKIQEFQSALKVGDQVVTTSGIHGEIAKLDDKLVQLQVADKVRLRIARAAIGGYQGQEPIVSDTQ